MYEYLNDEKYDYKYFHQDNVCRLCWIQSSDAKSLDEDPLLAENILENIGIPTKGHVLQKVCFGCVDKIESFVNFKKFCLEADSKLKTILTADLFKQKSENLNPHKTIPTYLPTHISEKNVLEETSDLDNKMIKSNIKKENESNKIYRNRRDLNPEHFDPELYDDDLFPKDCYCFYCETDLESEEYKKKHNEEKHNVKQKSFYQCFTCKKKFPTFMQQICHEIRCKLPLKTKANLRYRSSMTNRKQTTKTKPKITVLHKCDVCTETFERRIDWRKHRVKFHKKTEHICEICGRKVRTKSSLFKHLMLHTSYKQLKCQQCDYHASTKYCLKVHERRVHMRERRFACDRCPLRCFTRSILNDHLKTHYGIKDFVCDICSKRYSTKVSLQEHIIGTHQGMTRFPCNHCGSHFNRPKNLQKHMLKKHGIRSRRRDNFKTGEILPGGVSDSLMGEVSGMTPSVGVLGVGVPGVGVSGSGVPGLGVSGPGVPVVNEVGLRSEVGLRNDVLLRSDLSRLGMGMNLIH